ncbi:MAG: methylmalonyl-CoA epimerase [Acidobacteria bacterium]|nr:methylmalonyl-CoA epimerase [Acidobacteriota bacterium]
MKALLDHVGIAVQNLDDALAFYRDALGLEIEAPEEVASQRVRAHFVPAGPSSLELLEATAPDSPIARYLEKRGPGLHHITLRVDDLEGALAALRARGVRLIDERPRPGAAGSMVAFIHPSSAHGVLVELKQIAARRPAGAVARRITVGDFELISLSDGFFRLDGGAMFGVVPKVLWSRQTEPDDRNRIRLGMRPLVVRGARTMLIDAGIGDKLDPKLADIYGLEREQHLDHALSAAGLTPESIDIVLATHLHFDHAGGFTARDEAGRVRPRFPRAQYVIRRGEWEDAIAPNQRTRASYVAENFVPLAEARVLQLVDDDATIMPGVKVRRSGGHTPSHQVVVIESRGTTAVFAADMVPTVAHLPEAWVMGYDLVPLDTMRFKAALLREAVKNEHLVFFEHDPEIAAGIVVEEGGKRRVERIL